MSIMVSNVKTMDKLIGSFPVIKRATYERIDLFEWCKLIGNAYMLNIRSWNERYTDDVITDEEIKASCTLNLKTNEKFNNDCEILKALQCLSYNIELDHMNFKEKKVESDLKAVIEHLKNYIIGNLEDYKKAAWI
jgi:hypothetical protein